MEQGEPAGVIAARFHRGLVRAVSETAARLAHGLGLETVVLGGGVIQNRLLLEGLGQLLRGRGLQVLAPLALPANDGGLALGQAVIALSRLP